MIEKIHEHLVDTSLLPDGANILDIGCRGFLFAGYFDEINKGHDVVCVDIDYFPRNQGEYFQCAISDFNGTVAIIGSNDPQAKRITKDLSKGHSSVDSYKLSTFSDKVRISFWDLIKIDVEGSEFEIIMSLEKAPAKQLSIEFHLHTGVYGPYEVTLMEDKLKALGYYPASHEMTSEHGAGMNYWSSLWILK